MMIGMKTRVATNMIASVIRLEALAEKLGMSERTLFRRLAEARAHGRVEPDHGRKLGD
jgi:DNA-binding transcriptional regulator LsrR (DeoR family)